MSVEKRWVASCNHCLEPFHSWAETAACVVDLIVESGWHVHGRGKARLTFCSAECCGLDDHGPCEPSRELAAWAADAATSSEAAA